MNTRTINTGTLHRSAKFDRAAIDQAARTVATERHLQILSELAQMFSDKALRERLASDPDVASLHQHITAWQPHVADQRRAAV